VRTRLDALHARARRWPPFQRLAIITRILLAIAFIPTGTVKLLGHRFTTIPVTDPVGAYFEAMYQTGFYWNFLGAGQVAAGILLLIPATVTLGAVAFFPIILNVTVVTWSIGFRGTIYITALMLLASLFLLCWDYDRLRSIVFPPAERPAVPVVPMPRLERAGYLLGGAAGLLLFFGLRGPMPATLVRLALLAGALATLMVLAAWIRLARR
jgi:uncharacterized membrane protein YphA (DoxX/SURF4 family)